MQALRGITTSVGYGPILQITLIRNMRHLAECVVVTSPDDRETQEVARAVPGVRVLETTAFTDHGARFNKGLGVERGFDFMGRHGWICIWDADVLFPEEMPLGDLPADTLHGATRRTLADPLKWRPDLDWSKCPRERDGGPIGFLQIFNASAIIDKRPWYDVSFTHAGGCDAAFMDLFHPAKRRVLPFDVLHLGPRDTNWFGTSSQARDTMQAYIIRNGWARSHPHVDRSACLRVPDIDERVQVPGYEPSSFELPFVRRNRAKVK